jgi:predicted secreted protein
MGAAQTRGEGAYEKLTGENRISKGSYAEVYKIKRKDNNQVFAAKKFNVPISMLLPEEK